MKESIIGIVLFIFPALELACVKVKFQQKNSSEVPLTVYVD